MFMLQPGFSQGFHSVLGTMSSHHHLPELQISFHPLRA